jgi:DNA-binding TFAR19-related protein (PDSD5 family)
MNEQDIKKLQTQTQHSGAGSDEQAAQQKKMQEEAEAHRKNLLTQILEPDAYQRLSRIALVRPDRATHLENSLIKMASSRQLSGKVTDKQLVQMLEQFTEQTKPKTKITIQRKKNSIFDDDDEDFNSDSD